MKQIRKLWYIIFLCVSTQRLELLLEKLFPVKEKPVFAYSLVSLFQTMLNVGPIKNNNKLIGLLKLRKQRNILRHHIFSCSKINCCIVWFML